jgi:hypothetical protein
VKLTDEAVEAAAKAHHHELYPWVLWENLKPESREYYRDEVRVPLAAALPHLEGATPAIDREVLKYLLSYHYYDAKWSQEHQGFRCVCGWLGEDHVGHVVEVVALALTGGQP